MNLERRAFIGGATAFAAFAGKTASAEEAPDWAEVAGVELPDWAVKTIADGLGRYRAWKGTDLTVAFPLVTDLHSHNPCAGNEPNWRDSKCHVLFQRAIAQATGSDFLVNLGDLDFDVDILGKAPDWSKVQPVIDGFVAAYGKERRPCLFSVGNHDHAKGRYTSKQFGDTFNRGVNAPNGHDLHLSECGTWGYLDLPEKKFRMVFLNTSDEGYLGFSVKQMQFLSDTLASADEGWSVAVMQHANIPGFLASWRRFIGDGNFKRSGIEMQMIEDFANHRGDLVQGFNNPPIKGEFGGVKWDFSRAKADLVGVFQGHLHAESYLKYAKVNYVIRPGYGTIPWDCRCGEWRDAKREDGTGKVVFSPDRAMMIDLVAVKPLTREVHVFRFGCGGPKSELEYVYG